MPKSAYLEKKAFKIYNPFDAESTLLEPASCGTHEMGKVAPKLGLSIPMLGKLLLLLTRIRYRPYRTSIKIDTPIEWWIPRSRGGTFGIEDCFSQRTKCCDKYIEPPRTNSMI